MPGWQRYGKIYLLTQTFNFVIKASAVTTSGKDWVLDAKIIKNGRTYALDFDANKLSGNVATNVMLL